MAEVNVLVTVPDPDRLIAGTDPVAPFTVAKIQLYRYASEANARDNASGTLAKTWDIVASTTARADPDIAGPWRYGYYDSSQIATSWYRYRFADSGLTNFSELSDPWQAEPAQWALRDILFEVGDYMGGMAVKGTAATNADAGLIDCASLFKSTKRDARFYEGWWGLCSYDAGGASAAPELEEAIIDSVDTATGIATLDRDLTAAITASDTVLLLAMVSPSEMIRIINRVRSEMRVLVTTDIALTQGENQHPTPYGVWSETDVISGVGIVQWGGTAANRENEFEIDYRVGFDGFRGYIEVDAPVGLSPVARFRVLRSYRDIEGELTTMGDYTQAPIDWMRPAFAMGIVDHLLGEDPTSPELNAMRGKYEEDLRQATARYAPKFERQQRRGYGRRVSPGPVEVH